MWFQSPAQFIKSHPVWPHGFDVFQLSAHAIKIRKQTGSPDTLNKVQCNSHHKESRQFCVNTGHNCWHSTVLKFRSKAVWIWCTHRSTVFSGTLKPQVLSGYLKLWSALIKLARLQGQNQGLYIHTTYKNKNKKQKKEKKWLTQRFKDTVLQELCMEVSKID